MQQGNYPIGNRVLAPTDTVTGVVTLTTADIPLSALAAYVSSTLVNVGITGGTISGVAISASIISGSPISGSTGSFTSISGPGTGITGLAPSLSIGGLAAVATNIAAGAANQIPVQSASSLTTFIVAPTTANTILGWTGSAFIWMAPGSGTVTSVAVSGGTTGLTTSGGPITGSGTITLAGVLAVANGGTGGTTQASARSGLAAAGNGANSDITSLTGLTTPLSLAQGGTGTSQGSSSKIQSVSASVAGNALTVGLNPTALDFRSVTLGTGAPNTRTVAAALSLVVPSGATLGTVSAVQSRLVLIALDNAGTVELAIVNIAGGNNLDETTLISTTAISAGATAANVFYSTTGRTGVPFRVMGYVESTQAVAGAWATAPSTVQGYGGQATAALSSLGYSQTWQSFTPGTQRVAGTTYYNTTGRPISLSIYTLGNSGTTTITVNGAVVLRCDTTSTSSSLTAVIPPGSSYAVASSQGFGTWFELR